MTFHCIDPIKSRPIPTPPFIPENLLGRSVSIENLRLHIKSVHNIDLTSIAPETHARIQTYFHKIYGPGANLPNTDPLSFPNWLAYSKSPKYFGFHALLDLLHSDFLVVESMSYVKSSLGVDNLKNILANINSIIPAPPRGAKETIEYSVDEAAFHLVNAVYRLRSCFDKLVIAIGYSLQIGKRIKRKDKYDKKLQALRSSNQAKMLIRDQNEVFSELMNLIDNLGELKKLRDEEAHLNNIAVKRGTFGSSAEREISDLISTTLEYLEKFRIALLLFIAFLPTLSEGGEFPESAFVGLFEIGLTIVNVDTNQKFMSFVVDDNNALNETPRALINHLDRGVLVVNYDNDASVTIDFANDLIVKQTAKGKFQYNGDISKRNGACGFTKIV